MADGKDMGKFKSSGIIVSTGTGSSAWLYSSKQITYQDIQIVQKFIGGEKNTDTAYQQIARLINNKNTFALDSDKIYYFVREGFTTDPVQYSWRAEGYCKSLKVTSEMIDGSVQIDGYWKYNVGIGDQFYVTCNPEFSLKCIKLIEDDKH